MRYILISLIVVLFSGCITKSIPPKSEFRINPSLKAKIYSVDGCKDKSLKVAQSFSSNLLLSHNMHYRLGNTKQHIYSASLWSVSPSKAINMEFLKLIRKSELFKSVQVAKSRSKNDYLLEINIDDFMQYFSEDSKRSYANVEISLTLINAKTHAIIGTHTFIEKVDVEVLSASGGVDGLNTALSNILSQSTNWLAKVCK